MQKVIVTGGAGFIGSNLVDELIKQEIEVIILDNLSTGKKENINPRAIFYECDVSNMNMNSFIYLFKDVDTIFHLAATPQVQYSIEKQIGGALLKAFPAFLMFFLSFSLALLVVA